VDYAVEMAAIFREVIELIIRQGGDADTNGAVAGALVAAYLRSVQPTVDPIHCQLERGLASSRALDSGRYATSLPAPVHHAKRGVLMTDKATAISGEKRVSTGLLEFLCWFWER